MSYTDESHPDILGLRDQLTLALQDPALDAFDEGPATVTPDAAAAAYRAAVPLGYCRLFGVVLPEEEDGVLPAAEAIAATGELARRLSQLLVIARNLTAQWDDSTLAEGESLAAELIEARMDAWAAYIALSEAYEECEANGDAECPRFDSALKDLFVVYDQFNDVLALPDNLLILADVARMPLLENWRRLLASPYRDLLPWWLDGTLEKLADLPLPSSLMESGYVLASSETRKHAYRDALLSLEPQATAASIGCGVPRFRRIAVWNSPDGRYRAILESPVVPVPQQQVALRFVDIHGEEVLDMAGRPVHLGALRVAIDDTGCAVFDLSGLQEHVRRGHPLELYFGEDGTSWGMPADLQ